MVKRLFLTSNFSIVARYIAKELLPKKRTVLFIKTAAEVYGVNPDWLEADRSALKNVGFAVLDYSLTNKKASNLKKELQKHDVIFMSGGNTYYLLEKIQQSNTSKLISEFVEKGMPYIGSSAGSVIAGPTVQPVGNLDEVGQAPQLKGFNALGLVDFVVMSHWGFKKYASEAIKNIRKNYVNDFKFILLTDYQYVQAEDDMYKIIDIRDKK